ncbi:MAG TPA: AraC family ligand binding domain-containing protein [Solirubrobacteraceae bacterium]|jgi:mannose-6-phosphate isomerase-like protein (cupin superfamily)
MPRTPVIKHLDEFEAIAGPGTLTWRPVRFELGIRAFGCNAYTAAQAGLEVVEPHDEAAPPGQAGHEELYFVASGRAEFTIDGETIDAPAGTYVFLPDPESHRAAVAREAGTTVLSFGGPPTFAPSVWEWTFRASPLIRSDPQEARAIIEDGLRTHTSSPSLLYTLACLEAVSGNDAESLTRLREAIELQPALRERAGEDSDFESLRALAEFAALVSPD